MKTVFNQGWRFHFDEKKTKNLCCGPQVEWTQTIPELKAFFDELGIRLDQPVEIEEGGSLCYLMFGTAESEDGYEIDFYAPDQCISIVVSPYPDGYQGNGLEVGGPCVLLELFGAEKITKEYYDGKI